MIYSIYVGIVLQAAAIKLCTTNMCIHYNTGVQPYSHIYHRFAAALYLNVFHNFHTCIIDLYNVVYVSFVEVKTGLKPEVLKRKK